MSWVFEAQRPKGNIAVFRPIRDDALYIISSVRISEAHRATLARMSKADRSNLLWDLRLGLLRLELEFVGVNDPLELIEVRQIIYEDGLTKDRFFARLRRVFSGCMLIHWSVGRVQPKAESDPMDSETYLIH